MKQILLILLLCCVPTFAQQQNAPKDTPATKPIAPAEILLSKEESDAYTALDGEAGENLAQIGFTKTLLQSAEVNFDKARNDKDLLLAARMLKFARDAQRSKLAENADIVKRYEAWAAKVKEAHACPTCLFDPNGPNGRRLVRPPDPAKK